MWSYFLRRFQQMTFFMKTSVLNFFFRETSCKASWKWTYDYVNYEKDSFGEFPENYLQVVSKEPLDSCLLWCSILFSDITSKYWRLNFLLVARCSLLFAPCPLLYARCSLLYARCSLLFARCSLLFSPCSLLFARCSLLFARCLARNSEGFFFELK